MLSIYRQVNNIAKISDGKRFENAFKNSINEKHVLIKRLNDNAASFGESTNTRFTSTNECDFLLFENDTRTLYGLELKTTLGSLTYWRKDFEDKNKKQSFQIKKNQILGLEKFSQYDGGIFGFVINFRKTSENHTFFISISDFLKYTNTLSKKSINIHDVLQMNPIKIENRLLRTNYWYNLEKFFQDTTCYGLRKGKYTMKKTAMKLKESLTLTEKVMAINNIVSSNFGDDDYTPYYDKLGRITTIIKYLIDGIELENGDNLLELYNSDNEMHDMVDSVLHGNIDNDTLKDDWLFIMMQAADKIDFMKRKLIHHNYDLDKIVDAANVIIDSLENFSKLQLSELTPEMIQTGMTVMKKLADNNVELNQETISSIIKDAVAFNMDKATADIIDSKNEEIRELRKYKMLWDSRKLTDNQ